MTYRDDEPNTHPDRDETLETSRLLVEFLHASYATRRMDQGADAADDEVDRPLAGTHGPSAHAIRASIHIYQHGDRTVSQLAAGLGISLGWASRVADELVDRGHAIRERDPSDRRVVRLRMTDAALAEIEHAYRWRGDAVGRALMHYTPAERTAIRSFMRRVTDELTIAAQRPAGGGTRPVGLAAALRDVQPSSSGDAGHE